MNRFKKRLLKLYLDHPFDFNLYLEGFKNKDYAYRVIKSFIPTDTGLEWEIGFELVDKIKSSIRKSPWITLGYDGPYEVTYRIHRSELNLSLLKVKKLYDFLSKPEFESIRHSKSGIHIHTNLIEKSGKREFSNCKRSGLKEFVYKVATGYFHYGGSYNELRFDWAKGNAIIHRKSYNTIEYRCINMTWDFRELLKHIITCHHMTNLIIQCENNRITETELVSKSMDFVKYVYDL